MGTRFRESCRRLSRSYFRRHFRCPGRELSRGATRGRDRGRAPSGDGGVGRAGDRGAVTAETAVVIPVLAAFTLALLWALMAAADQIRCVDAARAGARAAA
ncbi:hypothetical protein G3M53_42765, partial [Streptomyces sp. SID7982]|nr:hypothetical protein [Streptomyces sp. SID7982]